MFVRARSEIQANAEIPDAQEFDALVNTFDGISLEVFQKVTHGSSEQGSILCIKDRGDHSNLNEKQWDEAQQMLVQGKTALDKLGKEAQRLLSLLNGNRDDPLWAILS